MTLRQCPSDLGKVFWPQIGKGHPNASVFFHNREIVYYNTIKDILVSFRPPEEILLFDIWNTWHVVVSHTFQRGHPVLIDMPYVYTDILIWIVQMGLVLINKSGFFWLIKYYIPYSLLWILYSNCLGNSFHSYWLHAQCDNPGVMQGWKQIYISFAIIST